VAQTKRKRQTKHRGNAAGVVESRGRTGRKPTAAEKSLAAKERAQAREKRDTRRDRPPTWKGAFSRALAAAVLVVVVMLLLLPHNKAQAFIYFPFVLVLYVPVSFYTDQWLYRRRMRSKEKQRAG
jgi:Flp pilus assembly protein TadB